MTTKHTYGWVPDVPDHRDRLYAAPLPAVQTLPPSIDLRSKCPKEIYDQGQLGSCTANAIAAAIEFDLMKQHAPKVFTPSRLFIYFNERVMEHTTSSDAGAQIRDGVKSVAKLGAPPESFWPYDDHHPGPFQERPNDKAYAEALNHKVTSYQRVLRTLNQLKGCLAAGYPFVFGFSVYESFESAEVAHSGNAPCRSPMKTCSEATPCWRWGTTTRNTASWRATRGEPIGARAATSRFLTLICWMMICRPTSGPSAPSRVSAGLAFG